MYNIIEYVCIYSGGLILSFFLDVYYDEWIEIYQRDKTQERQPSELHGTLKNTRKAFAVPNRLSKHNKNGEEWIIIDLLAGWLAWVKHGTNLYIHRLKNREGDF